MTTLLTITPDAAAAAGALFGWTIFVVGTFWFWLLLVVAGICIIGAIETESFGKAFATVVVTVLLLSFFGAGTELRTFLSWIWHHPGFSIGIFLGYLFVGSAWSIFKWYGFLKELKRKNDEKGHKKVWNRRQIVRDNKGRLINWMCYWPFSALWTALSDPFQAIYRQLTGVYGRIADKVLGPVVEEDN